MDKRLKNKLYDRMKTALLEKDFLKHHKISHEWMYDKIHEFSFYEKVENSMSSKGFKCEDVLNICMPFIHEYDFKGSIHWIKEIYEYACHQIFNGPVNIDDQRKSVYSIYLKIFKEMNKFFKEHFEENDSQVLWILNQLTTQTGKRFRRCYEEDSIYEIMKLYEIVMNQNIIQPIEDMCTYGEDLSKQLIKLGFYVDLQDLYMCILGCKIGKLKGNKAYEEDSYRWYENHQLKGIGNISRYHQLKDLEKENLSLTSLVLIYVHHYIYKDQGKLRIMKKLEDFHGFLKDLGVVLEKDLSIDHTPQNLSKHYALMQGQQIIKNLKYLYIKDHIQVMEMFKDTTALNRILEQMKSQESNSYFRGYLHVLKTYNFCIKEEQKKVLLQFLYEHLTHSTEYIRIQCALFMGKIIGSMDEKEESLYFFAHYLKRMLIPHVRNMGIHRKYLRESSTYFLRALFKEDENLYIEDYVDEILSLCGEDENIAFYIIQSFYDLPIDKCLDATIKKWIQWMMKLLETREYLKLYVLDIMDHMLLKYETHPHIKSPIKDALISYMERGNSFCEDYLNSKILKKIDSNKKDGYSPYILKKISNIFVSNLKTSTEPIVKKIQMDYLSEYAKKHIQKLGIYVAMHYCNILKVSTHPFIRNYAGKALLSIMKDIPFEERTDVAMELLRGIEVEGYEFARYIPKYLGKIMMMLKEEERKELVDQICEKIKYVHGPVHGLILETIGTLIVEYTKGKSVANQDLKDDSSLMKMLGVLQNGMVHNDQQVYGVAFQMMGEKIFGCKKLNLVEKKNIFVVEAKKILSILGNFKGTQDLAFFYHAILLKSLYEWISMYTVHKGEIQLPIKDKIAFFPGTFDPFSLGHKEIAKAIASLGYEVYLAVDEFSWSKKTQPHLFRRDIIKMSIADESGIYLYPQDIPINIANPKDLKTLKEVFKDQDVYIVVGSDVVVNASAYQQKKEKNSIQTFSHIIFERSNVVNSQKSKNQLLEGIKNIQGKVIKLALPSQYEHISSTQIREGIDEDRDISQWIDPMAQKYIYKRGLYKREPSYKTILKIQNLSIQVIENLSPKFLNALQNVGFVQIQSKVLKTFFQKLNARILCVRSEEGGKILGFCPFHWVRSSTIFHEFKDEHISEYIRSYGVGRILRIHGIFYDPNCSIKNLDQLILTETLSYALAKDYTYTVYQNMFHSYEDSVIEETLLCQGFNKIGVFTYVVNMSRPITLDLDIQTLMKEPFRKNRKVQKTIQKTRKKLQRALTKLYPGHLVLTFDRNMVYRKLIHKICKENKVSSVQTFPKKSGENMCVPFGAILNGSIIPNTVTKSIHTEKSFDESIKEFHITPYPHYLDLKSQVKMIGSFNRPVILVDDLLHKGYRIKAIDPILKQEKIYVKKVIVGILSGRGKELMDMDHRQIEGAYFIPRLRAWFNESLLYPFIGGDTMKDMGFKNLVPSVNLILPYTIPTFIHEAQKDSMYHLSKVCLENAKFILETLQQEYEKIYKKSLTLNQLGEVFYSPRYPYNGKNRSYDGYQMPAEYIKNDLKHLERLKIIDR